MSDTSVAPGSIVAGRFRVDRLIGKGGMGAVFAARNLMTGRDVALKIVAASIAEHPDQRRRFLREARASTAIRHPNVIEVFDVFEVNGEVPVMVMELLEGRPLSALVQASGRLSVEQTAAVLLPVATALRAAHTKGIVHRDLKPDNIFLADTPTGVVPKVLDFGIAKVLDPAQIGAETRGGHTRTGSLLGTPYYMSFEQAMSDKSIDHRTDIWSIGVIAYELLTGRRPLEFENLGQMYVTFLQGTVPSIRQALPSIPDDLGAVIDRCLNKEKEGRLSDLGELAEVLSRHAGARVDVSTSLGPALAEFARTELPTPSQRPLVKSLGASARSRRGVRLGAAGVAVAGAIGFVALRSSTPPPITAETAAPDVASLPVASAQPSAAVSSPIIATASAPTLGAAASTGSAPAPRPAAKKLPSPIAAVKTAEPPSKPAETATATNPAAPPAKGIVDRLPY